MFAHLCQEFCTLMRFVASRMVMMMISFIILNSSFAFLIEGLCRSNPWAFEVGQIHGNFHGNPEEAKYGYDSVYILQGCNLQVMRRDSKIHQDATFQEKSSVGHVAIRVHLLRLSHS